MHKGNLFEKDDRPVVIEICDSEEKIKAFLPVLDEIMESGLVTIEKARVIQYGRKRSSYLERLKKSLRDHLHLSPPMAKPSGPGAYLIRLAYGCPGPEGFYGRSHW